MLKNTVPKLILFYFISLVKKKNNNNNDDDKKKKKKKPHICVVNVCKWSISLTLWCIAVKPVSSLSLSLGVFRAKVEVCNGLGSFSQRMRGNLDFSFVTMSAAKTMLQHSSRAQEETVVMYRRRVWKSFFLFLFFIPNINIYLFIYLFI